MSIKLTKSLHQLYGLDSTIQNQLKNNNRRLLFTDRNHSDTMKLIYLHLNYSAPGSPMVHRAQKQGRKSILNTSNFLVVFGGSMERQWTAGAKEAAYWTARLECKLLIVTDARRGIRTPTPLRARDFKSLVSTIPPSKRL